MTPDASNLPLVLGHKPLDWAVISIFAAVYLGMFLGGLPRLKLDRSGVALLGAIAVIALTGMPLEGAAKAVDLPTIVLLFAFMVVSAQMRLGGFYTEVTRRLGELSLSRPGFTAALIAASAGLSAIFSNDIICLAMTPKVARICIQRRLDPTPFLVGLACASNIGSAATLIGNPQNMLLGSVLQLPFAEYARVASVPVVLSLIALWIWLNIRTFVDTKQSNVEQSEPTAAPLRTEDAPPFDYWQTIKGLSVAISLMLVFVFTDWNRDVAALVGAAILLLSRRLHSAQVMGFVDWQLLLLFIGLFVVNHAFEQTGLAADAVAWLSTQGIHLEDPGVLLVTGALLSNLVSNVPAVMLLLPHLGADPQHTGMFLALVSTFAGNLFLVGSIANLIVADLAAKEGITLDWKHHAAIGIPVTLLSLLIVWVWISI